MENLSIKAVSQIVGITPFTLRAWENRYLILKPKRGLNGRRVYSLSDVEKLRLIVALKNAGHSLSDISQLTIKQLSQLLEKTPSGPDGSRTATLRVNSPQAQIPNILKSIREVKMDLLTSQLKMLQLQLDTRSFLMEVIVPTLQILGAEVAEGRLDIFHEHAVSALIRHLLTGILYSTEKSTSFRNHSPLVFANPEGDHHEFGALIAAILALLNGYRVFYLGPNMPADSLAKATEALVSPLVVVSSSAPEESLNREQLLRFFQELLRQLPKDTALWIGGARSQELRALHKDLRPRDLILVSLQEFDRKLRLNLTSV